VPTPVTSAIKMSCNIRVIERIMFVDFVVLYFCVLKYAMREEAVRQDLTAPSLKFTVSWDVAPCIDN
jgi:hypothetical protein